MDRVIDFLDCRISNLARDWTRVRSIHHTRDALSQQDHFGAWKGAALAANLGRRREQTQQTEISDTGVDYGEHATDQRVLIERSAGVAIDELRMVLEEARRACLA